MNRAIKQFEANIESAKQLGVIYQAFAEKVTEAICLDELLRAEIVLGVSAMDCYIHDLVRIGMEKAFLAATGESKAYLNFRVSLEFVKDLVGTELETDRLALFAQEIRRFHGFKTFQAPDNISQALSLLGIASIWDKVGTAMVMSSTEVRTHLDLIIDRRNQIAHEGDINPVMGIGEKYPIDYATVAQAIGFLDSLAHQIQTVAIAEVVF